MQAASLPVVAVTAWQMRFDYAQAKAGQAVLIHGAAGNVGSYAVQLAKNAQLCVYALPMGGVGANFDRLGATQKKSLYGVRDSEAKRPVVGTMI